MKQRWQDWAGLVLGVLLFISPWVIGYSAVSAAAGTAWVLGVATTVFFAIALGKPQQWEEWVNLVLAILLLIAPFVFGFVAVSGAAWTHWILAILIGGDAIWALAEPGGSAQGAA